jgi:hypothetical protein
LAKRASAQRRDVAREWLRHAQTSYRETENPVYAWDAIAECLSAGLPLPKWVRDYLLSVAVQITTLSRNAIPRKGDIDRAVANALRLKGRSRFNPFTELGRPAHELMVAMQVYQYHTRHPGYSWEAIFDDVAKAHRCLHCVRSSAARIGPGTVKALWYRHALSVIPPHLVDRSPSKKLDDILRQQGPSR